MTQGSKPDLYLMAYGAVAFSQRAWSQGSCMNERFSGNLRTKRCRRWQRQAGAAWVCPLLV